MIISSTQSEDKNSINLLVEKRRQTAFNCRFFILTLRFNYNLIIMFSIRMIIPFISVNTINCIKQEKGTKENESENIS